MRSIESRAFVFAVLSLALAQSIAGCGSESTSDGAAGYTSAGAGPGGAGGSAGSTGGSSGTGGLAGSDAGLGAAGGMAGQDAATDAPPEATEAGLPACTPSPVCNAAPPNSGPEREWKHWDSSVIALSGSPNHRGRDLFLNPGDQQWVIGKFAYGAVDKDMKDEEVDLYLLRGCTGSWEKLATVSTTEEGAHPMVEGVEDDGGRVFYQIPAAQQLGIGRHRIHMILAGDLSSADLFIEVVPKGTAVFVSDIDGTLTLEETEEYGSLLTGSLSGIRPGAPEAFQALVAKGYRPFYMTARPEWLVGRTREFLTARGLPDGIVHTTLGKTGALGSSAAEYKTGELNVMNSRGLRPHYAFGNTDTDAKAYKDTGITPADHRIFVQYTDEAYGGRRIEAYTEIVPEFTALPEVCE